MSESKADYITEAMELLEGEPSLEIESPRIVTERRNGRLVDVEKSAFVKIYTSFKGELKDMDGNDLKVWMFIALSVNRNTKDARPGLRKIANETGLAVNTVQGCLERLEKQGLLDVERREGTSNIYHPADYASVSKFDTPSGTVSKKGSTVSIFEPTVSVTRRDFAQLEELEELDNGENSPSTLPLEWQIASGVKQVTIQDSSLSERVEFASLVSVSSPNPALYGSIALAFQNTRNLTLPKSSAKAQRKAIRDMVAMGVTPAHVEQATRTLLEKDMTITDLFSVSKTAIDLANKPQVEPVQRPEYKHYEPEVGEYVPNPNSKHRQASQ